MFFNDFAAAFIYGKGSGKKNQDILWHWVDFIFHLPTLPYDIVVNFLTPTYLQVSAV